MRIKLLFVIFLIISVGVLAQTPDFTVSKTYDCVPTTVSITGITTVSGTIYTYNFNVTGPGYSNLIQKNEVELALTVLGVYVISASAGSGGGGIPIDKTISITVSDTSAPNIAASECTGRRVVLNILDPPTSIPYKYKIFWGDGTNTVVGTGVNSVEKSTYPDESPRVVNVVKTLVFTVAGAGGTVSLDSCSSSSTITVRPYSNFSLAGFNFLELSSYSLGAVATLNITTDDRVGYKVFQSNISNSALEKLTIITTSGTNNYTFGGINGLISNCFWVQPFDVCNSNPPVNSEICTYVLSVNPTIQGNDIKVVRAWYYLIISVNGTVFDAPVQGFTNNDYNKSDTNVRCRANYCYRVSVYNNNNYNTSPYFLSPPVCVTALKPAPYSRIEGFNATFENDKLKFFWKPQTLTGVTYNVYALDDVADTTKRTFIDSTGKSFLFPKTRTNNPCYLANMQDQCGTGPFSLVCPLRLNGEKQSLNSNLLYWADPPYKSDYSVVNYVLQMFTESGEPINNMLMQQAFQYIQYPIDTVNQVVKYRVYAVIDTGGATMDIYSNYVSIKQDVRLFVPSAFTPDGDGLNESFIPKGLFWTEYELKIYNRWGQTVFSSNNKNDIWDGGNNSPGLYNYYIRVKDKFGTELVKSGYLNLIR